LEFEPEKRELESQEPDKREPEKREPEKQEPEMSEPEKFEPEGLGPDAIIPPPPGRQCTDVCYQSMDVCVAVDVTPSVRCGPAEVRCCGDPVVRPGGPPPRGSKNGSCRFVVTQTICVAVPLSFTATAVADDPIVESRGVNNRRD
jgi:hypothetical protein